MPKAPLAEFLERLLDGLGPDGRVQLIIEQLSYNRYSPEIDALEAFMCVAPVEKNQWIWARVERDLRQGIFEECFFVSSADQVKYIESLPLHHSQTVVEQTEDYTVFQYHLVPTFDFKQEILSRGPSVKVLSPEWFADEVAADVKEMMKLYEK